MAGHALAVALVLAASLAAGAPAPLPERGYVRPPASPELALSHPRLAKKADPHEPEQLHLALAGPGRVAVSWVTRPQDDAELATAVARSRAAKAEAARRPKDPCSHLADFPLQPTARYGLASGNLNLQAAGSFTCYADSQYASGALHTVLLGTDAPLLPGATYYYRAGDPQLGWSAERSFVAAPPVSPDSVPYKLGLIGDLGQTADSAQTLEHLDAVGVASVLDVGDLSYADSYQPRWDSYGRLLEFHTSKVPWMHIEGNHEEEVLGGESGFVAYERRFWFPAEESGSRSNFYYSYETGPLHVVMLGCYVAYGEDSPQAAWLRADLASVDRSRTPWLLVGMHAPWYNSNTAHQGEVDDMREAMERHLYEHGVDAVFAGHVHAYERSLRGIFQGKPRPCAPTYVVIGDGGNREGLATEYLKKPQWSAVREASFGMGVLTVHNATHALWEWHRNQDNVAQVLDELWLVRSPECGAGVGAGLGSRAARAGANSIAWS